MHRPENTPSHNTETGMDMAARPSLSASTTSTQYEHPHHLAHGHGPAPHEPEADLEYIQHMPPRLRTSVDSELAVEYAEAAASRGEPEKLDDDGKFDEKEPHGGRGGQGPGGRAPKPALLDALEPGAAAPLERIASVGPPPDGGLRAWLVVVGSAFSMFCVNGFVTGTGQFQSYYLAHQLKSYSTADVAWLASVQITLTFGLSVISGALFDAYSARPLVVLSAVGQFGSLVAIAFSKTYYQFLLSHAAFGIAGAIVYSPASGIAAHWFLRRRGTAVAVIMSGGGLGGVIYPILVKNLTDRFVWRDAILILAGIHFCLMLPPCLFMKKRLPNRPPVPVRALARPWKDIRYCFLVAGQCLSNMVVFSPYFNAGLYARSNGANATIVGYAVTILQSGNVVGRLSSGPLADRFGTWLMYVLSAGSCAVALFAFWVARMNEGGTVAGLVLYGMVSGAHLTLPPAVIATISPTHEIGMRVGLLWTMLAVPMLVGPVITGELIAAAGRTYKWAGLWNALTFCLAASLLNLPGIVRWFRNRKAGRATAGDGEQAVDTEAA